MADIVSDVSTHHIFRIDSGAMRFKTKAFKCKFWLLSRYKPYKELYMIQIADIITIKNFAYNSKIESSVIEHGQNARHEVFIEYWISLYNGCIRVGCRDQMCIEYIFDNFDCHNNIGFIRFHVPRSRHSSVHWKIEAPPFIVTAIETKQIEGGKMHWVAMTSKNLPPDALIGGFENEQTYIARANHNGSLCPGRYVPSQGIALVPWGFREHKKYGHFEILCGYDAEWVPTKSNFVPDNALIAGYSERRNEPLYIGRAMHEGNLITGKVHPFYKMCYLPYHGKEIEIGTYEILVLPYKEHCGLLYTED